MQTLKIFSTLLIGIIILIILYNINILFFYLYLILGSVYVICVVIKFKEDFFPNNEKRIENIIINTLTILLGIICWLPKIIETSWKK